MPPPAGIGAEAGATKGARTRARIIAAAEEIFGRLGYHDASIAAITQRANVAQGSFYVHFPSKHEIFTNLIRDRGVELRERLREATVGLTARADIDAAGFGAFFAWIAEHPWLYRVTRQAEFVDPDLREEWYRAFAEEYILALRYAMDHGEMPRTDPEVLAWAVMGMADFTAMRWIVWEEGRPIAPDKLEAFIQITSRLLSEPTS